MFVNIIIYIYKYNKRYVKKNIKKTKQNKKVLKRSTDIENMKFELNWLSNFRDVENDEKSLV